MQVAVTGASGLVGRALVDALVVAGHTPKALARGRDWDPERGTAHPEAIEGSDAVVHLGGEPIAALRWTAAKRDRIRRSRVEGTTSVARAIAALADPPSVLLSASAVGVYGFDHGDEVLTESSPTGSGFLADVCLAWEGATAPAAEAGVRTVLLRSGIILAREGGALATQLPLFRLGLGGRLGSGRGWFSWVTLADHVGAILHLLDAAIEGPVNMTAPEPVTNAAFTEALASQLHRPAFLTAPAPMLRLAAGRSLADEFLLASQRVVPGKLLADGYRFSSPDVATALSAVLGTR